MVSSSWNDIEDKYDRLKLYGAVQRDRPMSTERAREKTVEELNLQDLDDDEAIRVLKLANEGVYDTDDMPERWQGSSKRWKKTSIRNAAIR